MESGCFCLLLTCVLFYFIPAGRSLSIPVTLRMVIVKSREKAEILREQEIRAQQQQQQENNDLYHYNLNGNDQAMDSTLSSFLSQQFISNFRQNNSHPMEAAVAMQQHSGDGKLSQAANLQSVSLAAAQKAATQAMIHNFQNQQQQQQHQQILQRQLQQQGLARSMSNGSTPQQIKQNAMLLNMVRKEE